MPETVLRMLWLGLSLCAFSYVLFLALGSIVEAQAYGASAPVVVRDELSSSEHLLSGMVTVASCDELSVQTTMVSSTTYALIFQTWQDPSVSCTPDQMPRAFRTTLYAPMAGIQFIATLNGADLPIAVLPVIPGN